MEKTWLALADSAQKCYVELTMTILKENSFYTIGSEIIDDMVIFQVLAVFTPSKRPKHIHSVCPDGDDAFSVAPYCALLQYFNVWQSEPGIVKIIHFGR